MSEVQTPQVDISKLNLSPQEIKKLEEYVPLFENYKVTPDVTAFLQSKSQITCLFTGNQRGKTHGVAWSYVLRWMGMHPNPAKNIDPQDPVRTYRFAAETLPTEPEGEVRNTVYPALKKWLPPSMVKKDITIRKPVLTIRCPRGGPDIYAEFVSFSQSIQAQAGVQRKSCYIDENSGKGFFEEQLPRLLQANGDLIMGYTPTPGTSGWEFDDLFERARWIYRSKAVRKRIYQRTGEYYPPWQETDSPHDITCIMAATDDNPILDKGTIQAMFDIYADEDIIDARRYGLFRQLSGKVFKEFTPQIHVISPEKYFSDGIPGHWKFFRGIDYHQATPWACVFIAVSPDDEIFVWDELNPDPKKVVTHEIAWQLASKSLDYRYGQDLIDPLAHIKQSNTGFSTIDDLNRSFRSLKLDGKCTGAWWRPWDTKSTRGREEFKKRLKNSLTVGVPFNNKTINGQLPTIWFFNTCRQTIDSMKQWRYDEWASRDQEEVREMKDKPIERYSHFPITIECLLKEGGISQARWDGYQNREPKRYFAGAR